MEERRGKALSWDDCICPVCLEMFVEPVTLPCTHTFCKGCFLESVDKTTLCCPMCRKRVSTWARLNGKKKTMVNEQLWRQIQTSFPKQCQRRLSGQDASVGCDLEVSVLVPRVSEPGELRQEYEDQISKLSEEKRTVEEEQRKASEEYIQRLLAEEEMLLLKERKRAEDDERFARLLSQELNSGPSFSDNNRPITPANTKEKVNPGQIKKFLCPLPKTSSSDSSPTSSFLANKENILISQRKLLSHSEHPVPKLDYYGSQSDSYNTQTERSEPPTLHTPSVLINVEGANYSESYHTGDAEPSPSKRKSSELEMTEEEVVMLTKRGCHSAPSTSSSSSLYLQNKAAAEEAVKEMAEREAELVRRQEEEDWQLAWLLQKELNQEEKQRATDRRKGSTDAYLLREKGDKTKAESTAVSSTKTKRTSTATTNISSSSSHFHSASSFTTLNNKDALESSSSSLTLSVSSFSISSSSNKKMTPVTSSLSGTSVTQLSRISKQATLTDMFPGKLIPAKERQCALYGSETLSPSE